MEGEDLAALLERPDDKIDLGRAAFLLARTEYPKLDLDAELARLDHLAAQAEPYMKSGTAAPARLDGLRCFLAEVCGFRGNEEDYYDPRNSFLNLVLDRRTGIPITLCVVYIEIGRRLGIPLYGVGLPGHFLVKYQDAHSRLFLDPFRSGRTVTLADCREIVLRMYQGQVQFREGFLAAVDKRYILLRMLNNLRGIYLQSRQYRKALRVVEMTLAINPASGEDLKLRGVIHYRLHNHKLARQNLEAYLLQNPEASDAEEVKQTLTELKRVSAMLN